jgi:hypothetical protein
MVLFGHVNQCKNLCIKEEEVGRVRRSSSAASNSAVSDASWPAFGSVVTNVRPLSNGRTVGGEVDFKARAAAQSIH